MTRQWWRYVVGLFRTQERPATSHEALACCGGVTEAVLPSSHFKVVGKNFGNYILESLFDMIVVWLNATKHLYL